MQSGGRTTRHLAIAQNQPLSRRVETWTSGHCCLKRRKLSAQTDEPQIMNKGRCMSAARRRPDACVTFEVVVLSAAGVEQVRDDDLLRLVTLGWRADLALLVCVDASAVNRAGRDLTRVIIMVLRTRWVPLVGSGKAAL